MFIKRVLTDFVHTILGFDSDELLPTYQLIITAVALVFFIGGMTLLSTMR